MKKIKQIGAAILAFCVLMGLQTVKAAALVTDTPESYKVWTNLSEEEKEKYIQPLPFNVTYEDSSKSVNSRIYSSAKGTYQDTYQLSNIQVKDQEDTNECWAFTISSVLESNLYKLLGTSYTLSPRHMDYSTSKTFADGINPDGHNREVGDGGNAYIGLSYYTSGHGPVAESSMPFVNNENKINLSEIKNKTTIKKVKDYVSFPNIYKEYTSDGITYYNGYNAESPLRVNYTDAQITTMRNNIKEHIMKYGAISAYTYASSQDSINYYNTEKVQSGTVTTVAYYCDNTSVSMDHAVTIVGWDDTYSKDNFNDNHKPSKDGAYIVLNSYGENSFNNGYLYISYEDVLIEQSLFGITETSDIDYDNLYQYDPLGFSLEYTPQSTSGNTFSSLYGANVFETKKVEGKIERLTEISFYIASNTSVEVYANTQNGNLAEVTLLKNLGTLTPGYHTYTLEEPINLTGEKFVVALKYSTDVATIPLECNFPENGGSSNYWDTATSETGQSYVSPNGTTWTDLIDLGIKESNVCIKAFSKYAQIPSTEVEMTEISLSKETVEMKVGDTYTVLATVKPENTTNKTLIWTSSDEKIATVDANGKISGIKEGTATITVSNEAKTVSSTCRVTVSAPVSGDNEETQNKVEEQNSIPDSNIIINTGDDKNSEDDETIDKVTQFTGTEDKKTNLDTTVSQNAIPQAGINTVIIIASIAILGTIITITMIKLYQSKDIK